MRRIVSILFLSLMLLQAIPVLHFFSSQKEVFYTNIDEEKPNEKIAKEKKEGKEYLSLEVEPPVDQLIQTKYSAAADTNYSSPTLTFLTPPPDAC
ncbi:MAG TPA: hypothetical protein VF609_01395 [Flavisolibacter sp.]|jgi:hypothetical protein